VPTFHVHETRPPTGGFGYSPAACDGPLLYSTVIEQVRDGETDAVSRAYEPAPIGEVTEIRRTRAAAVAGMARAARRATIGTRRGFIRAVDTRAHRPQRQHLRHRHLRAGATKG
jgi:hypothetical protein